MTQSETQERVAQIRDRRNALQLRHGDWPCQTVHNGRERAFQQYVLADIDFLLSLIDSHASVAAPPNPWVELIGKYKDDPTWREFEEFLESYRAETDRVYADSVAATVDAEMGGLVAMFMELYNCYAASKSAASVLGDREEYLRLKGMAEAYQDAAQRCRQWPARRRNDGTLAAATPTSTQT